MLGCTYSEGASKTVIKGNVTNLPNGWMYLLTEDNKIIDSTLTKDGVFSFIIPFKKNQEPTLLSLKHKDEHNINRLFQFFTNRTFKGQPLRETIFMSDSLIEIRGSLIEQGIMGIKLPDSIKIVHPDTPLITGRQTKVMYNISYDFTSVANDIAIDTIKKLIQKYPYSYYFLYELRRWMSVYSNDQLSVLLPLFDEDMQKGTTMQEIKKRMVIRNTKGINVNITLLTIDNQHEKIIDNHADVNMVILWASWCGPCRQEIKPLKDLYKRFSTNQRFHMVSVSIDTDKDKWIEAVKEENMPWQQLWIILNVSKYRNEMFGFDGAIPTVIFTDGKGQTLAKVVGYDENNLEKYSELILKYIGNKK